ncbi:ankyrin repeat domain-containing protein [bacterium]|nr:ankyrin repeat domain-containing protein [bacterium]
MNYKERGWVNKINPDFFRKNVHANELLLMEILEPYEHDLRKALLKDRLKTVLGFERSSKLVLQAAVNEEICLPALLEKRLLDLGILEKIVIPDLDIDPDEERDIANFAELIDALSEESELPQSLLLLALFEQAYHRQRVEDQSWTDYIVSSSQSIACKARHEKKGYQSLISCSEISTYGLSALSENHIIEMEEQIVNQWCHQSNLNIRLNLPTLALVNKERLTQLKKIYLRLDSLEYDDLNSSDILDYCDGDILEALYIDNELPSDQLNDLLVKSIDRPHTGLIGVILKTENEDFSFQINDIFELARDAFHVDKKELALFLLTEFSKIRYGTKENLLCAHIRRKQIHVAELLLELGCIPDPIDFDDKTALGIALDVKSIAGVKALLKHGADPDIKSADDYPVHLAAQHTSKQLMCLLDLFQADLNVEDDNGNTPLMIAIKDHNTQVIDFLLERKVKLDHRNLDGENVLTLALKAGLDYYATEFYRQGVKLKEKRYAKQESLTVFYAIENGCKDFINILIEQGYDFSHVNDNGHSSLVVAILNNQLEIASSFIQAGIDLDQYHGCINTPVMAAFTIGEFGVLRQLVDKHVDLNIVRQDGHTLLTLAIESESKDVVDICLKHQEHSRKTLRRGQKNPLMLGIKIDNPGIVDSLLKKIDLDDYSQINLVLYALENDAVYSLFCLLEAGHALDLNNAHQSCCFKVMISNDPVRFFLVMKESIPELSDQLVLALVEFFRPYNTFLDQDDQLYLACITGDQSLLTADLQAMMISHESNLLNLAQRFKQDNIYNFLSKKIDEIKRTDKKRSLTESLESSIPLWPTGLNLSSTSKKQKNQSKPSMSNA